MVGCFNISLFSYFDIHRIFDLLSYRMWDFVLWWFDLDFLIFDFNFDFIMCLSFIFIFLIHFFLKLVFSFLINYVICNALVQCNVIKTIVVLSTIGFVTFLFSINLTICLSILELFIALHVLCFHDFTGFFEVTPIILKGITHANITALHTYLMFYYILNVISYLCLVALRFFFSYTYELNLHLDYNITNRKIDLKCKSLNFVWLLYTQYLQSNHLPHLYTYLFKLNVNVLISYTLVLLFYEFTIFYNIQKVNLHLLFLKTTRYLFTLNVRFSITNNKHTFSNITYVHLFTYIIFLINHFGILIKDFSYINFVISYNLIFYTFTYYIIDFNLLLSKWYKKQLTFVVTF